MIFARTPTGIATFAAAATLAAITLASPGHADFRGAGATLAYDTASGSEIRTIAYTSRKQGRQFTSKTGARLICTGGKIKLGKCYCTYGDRRFQTRPNAYRCIKMPGNFKVEND